MAGEVVLCVSPPRPARGFLDEAWVSFRRTPVLSSPHGKPWTLLRKQQGFFVEAALVRVLGLLENGKAPGHGCAAFFSRGVRMLRRCVDVVVDFERGVVSGLAGSDATIRA